MKHPLLALLLLLSCFVHAQSDSTSRFTIGAYAEPYFSYDLNDPSTNTRPYLYSYNRHNEVNVNLGLLKAAYAADRVRANVALGVGTYMRNNYAAEPEAFRNIFELNAGVRLSRKQNLWLDMGVLPSHIGFESAIGKDCRTLTRSLIAEGSPYFETGAKLSYTTPNGKLLLSVLALNGWQRIQRVSGNSLTSIGTQIQYKTDNVTLNASSFVGTDRPDAIRTMRFFNDFYGIFGIGDNLEVTLGLDYGLEERDPSGRDFNGWVAPIGIIRYAINDRFALAARGEYFNDRYEVIFSTGTEHGFNVLGFSLNFDWTINEHAMWRVEGRLLSSEDEVFPGSDQLHNATFGITSGIAVSF